MQINFYPDSDAKELLDATEEYKQIWAKEGSKIITEIEKVSKLKFTRKYLNAIVWWERYSYSYALSFSYSTPTDLKAMETAHELCHRLMKQNNIEPKDFTHENTHKQIFLFLYDVYLNLFGKDKTQKKIEHEISLWTGEGISPYKTAWSYVSKMTKEERQKEFQKYLQK